jgi:hypothetical protein
VPGFGSLGLHEEIALQIAALCADDVPFEQRGDDEFGVVAGRLHIGEGDAVGGEAIEVGEGQAGIAMIEDLIVRKLIEENPDDTPGGWLSGGFGEGRDVVRFGVVGHPGKLGDDPEDREPNEQRGDEGAAHNDAVPGAPDGPEEEASDGGGEEDAARRNSSTKDFGVAEADGDTHEQNVEEQEPEESVCAGIVAMKSAQDQGGGQDGDNEVDENATIDVVHRQEPVIEVGVEGRDVEIEQREGQEDGSASAFDPAASP